MVSVSTIARHTRDHERLFFTIAGHTRVHERLSYAIARHPNLLDNFSGKYPASKRRRSYMSLTEGECVTFEK